VQTILSKDKSVIWVWLGFAILTLFPMYSLVKAMINDFSILDFTIIMIIIVLFVYGSIKHGKSLLSKEYLKPDFLDFFFTVISVVITYIISKELNISVVISSAIIGLLGFIFLRKYQMMIYCGSFAGMVSSQLFGYSEVLVLALVCGLVYLLTKNVFNGFGGKLGSIAFVSSLVKANVFNISPLIASGGYNYLVLVLVGLIGVLLTFYLVNNKNISSVLASAGPSLIISVFLIYILRQYSLYAFVYFAASFLGMSSKEVLKNYFQVVLGALMLGLIYYLLHHCFNGYGGKLGLMAFISSVSIFGLFSLIEQTKSIFVKKYLKQEN